MTREEAVAHLQALADYGVIGYRVSAHRPGEHGPHLEVWKGPRFAYGLPAEAPPHLHRLLARLSSGEVQQFVKAIEGR